MATKSQTTTKKQGKKFKVLCTDKQVREIGERNKVIVIPKSNIEQFPIIKDAYRAWIVSDDHHMVVKTTIPRQIGMTHGFHCTQARWIGKSDIHEDNLRGRAFGDFKHRDNELLKENGSETKCIIASIDNETFYPDKDFMLELQEEAIDLCESMLALKSADSHYYQTQLERHQRYLSSLHHENLEKEVKSEKDLKTEILVDVVVDEANKQLENKKETK